MMEITSVCSFVVMYINNLGYIKFKSAIKKNQKKKIKLKIY